MRFAMDPTQLRKLLESVRSGRTGVKQALEKLKSFPTDDLGFARYDTHRALRQGFPEVILARGKTDEQVLAIFQRISKSKHPILITRATEQLYTRAVEFVPTARYHTDARAITVDAPGRKKPPRKGLLVLTAGTSDIPVAEEAAVTAETMGCEAVRVYDVGVAGIHRVLGETRNLQSAKVIIVIAGMEGALPSVVGGLVAAPVIAVPTSVGYGASFEGVAALLGMLNSCAAGTMVMNIDNGFGAGYAASRILSLIPQKKGR